MLVATVSIESLNSPSDESLEGDTGTFPKELSAPAMLRLLCVKSKQCAPTL